MTDIHIQGLRALGESLTPTGTHQQYTLATLPAVTPKALGSVFYASFSQRDIFDLVAALEARDARITELEAAVEAAESEQEHVERQKTALEKTLESVEKERDDAIADVDRLERDLSDMERERDEALRDLEAAQ